MIKRHSPTAIAWFIALAAVAPLSATEEDRREKREQVARQKVSHDQPAMLPLYDRFASKAGNLKAPPTDEVPDFQRHVSPLFGRLGCNGRACHGSFQGKGGFQLSLFGYDFKADHDALVEAATGRIDLDDHLESLVLSYPTDADAHGGGKRFDEGGWEYWVLRNWIESGAKFERNGVQELDHLEVTPAQIQFAGVGQDRQLRVIAHWEDGSSEDVTCLCRFHSNDAAISDIDAAGTVTCKDVGDTHVVVSYDSAVVPVQTFLALSSQSGENFPSLGASTKVDQLVLSKLEKLGIIPSELSTDEEFLRRASLDVTGSLPTAQEVREFVADSRSNKRLLKADELLNRPGYAARWTTFFCDITGNNDDQLRNFLPVVGRENTPDTQWYHWVKQRLEQNVPYDELVEGIVTAESRKPGESYREYCEAMSDVCRSGTGEKFADRPGLTHYWARKNFQTAEDRAIGFAYSFLGVRIQCAQCHKHPFDQWSKDDFDNFEKLFARVQARQTSMQTDAKAVYPSMLEDLGIEKKLKGNLLRRELSPLLKAGKTIPFPEIVLANTNRSAKNKKRGGKVTPPPKAKLLGSDWVEMDNSDAREYLMNWLRSPQNPYFAKAIVNRIWAQYFSVGIINPADDINLANAPSNGPLLDYLADGLRDNEFDLKWLHRQILRSDTYQRSWRTNETNAADKHNFSRAVLRRLPAESAFDAVRLALVSDAYVERALELDVPRAHLVAGSSNRALAGSDDTNYALSVFGRNVRESNCDCDRSEESSLLQTVFLLNDNVIHQWLNDPKNSWVRQVADKYGWPKPISGVQDTVKARQFSELLERLEKQYAVYKVRLATIEENGNKKQFAQLKNARKQQLAKAMASGRRLGYKEELAEWLDARESDDNASPDKLAAKTITPEQTQWIVENAYLRSLSRQPTQDEFDAAALFLQSTDNPTSAVAGLMWSLVNTKEFILNH